MQNVLVIVNKTDTCHYTTCDEAMLCTEIIHNDPARNDSTIPTAIYEFMSHASRHLRQSASVLYSRNPP